MRLACVVVALVACSKKEPARTPAGSGAGSSSATGSAAAPVPTPPPAVSSPIRFVAIGDKTARIIEVDATGAKVVTTAHLPQEPVKVVWAGKDPVVMFATSNVPDTTDDPTLDGRLGAITGAGFNLLPALPASTWVIPKPKGATNLGANWDLQASTTGETWQGRCEWGGIEDGGHCDEWVWARLDAAFPLSSRTPPPGPDNFEWTPAAPAPGYAVTFTPEEDNEYHSTITCKGGGATLTLPSKQHPEPWDKESGVRWISTDPPMFVADQIIEGYEGSLQPVVFEGCAWSTKLDGATLFAGPENVLVIANGATMSVRRDGKEIASLPGADLLAFAPDAVATTSAFAILERELAGDTSMLSPDSTVLAPAPTSARGVHLVPGAIKNARIIAYHADTAGEARWLAAEIEITMEGAAHTYRTTQLVDGTGHVIVASFAPLKPLARAATAPVIPQPTEAGPLAAFLTAPSSAATALDEYSFVFGTDANERGGDETEAKKLLDSWSKLSLHLDPAVREVRTAKYGYALANVSLAKPGGAPYRMTALVIGHLAADNTWKLAALHYLAL